MYYLVILSLFSILTRCDENPFVKDLVEFTEDTIDNKLNQYKQLILFFTA